MAEPGSASERSAPSPEPLKETIRTPLERHRLGYKFLAILIVLSSLGVLGRAVDDEVMAALDIMIPPALVSIQAILAALGIFAAWAI